MEILSKIRQFFPNFSFTQFTDSFSNKDSCFYKKVASYFPSFSADTKSWCKSRPVYVGLGLASLGFLMMRYFSKGSAHSDSIRNAVKNAERFSLYVKNSIAGVLLVEWEGASPIPRVKASEMTHPIMRTKGGDVVKFIVFAKNPAGESTYAFIDMYRVLSGNWYMTTDKVVSKLLPFVSGHSLDKHHQMQEFVTAMFESRSYLYGPAVGEYTFELVQNPSQLGDCLRLFS